MIRILFLLLLLTACSGKTAISSEDFLGSYYCIQQECEAYARHEYDNEEQTIKYKVGGDSTGRVHITEIRTYNNKVQEILVALPYFRSNQYSVFMDIAVDHLLFSLSSSESIQKEAKVFFTEQVYTERSIYDQSSYPYYKVGAYKMTAGTADIGMYEYAKKYNYVMFTLDE